MGEAGTPPRKRPARTLNSPPRDRRDQGANPPIKDRVPLESVEDLERDSPLLFRCLTNYNAGRTPTYIRWYHIRWHHGQIFDGYPHIIVAYDGGYNRMFRAKWNGNTLWEILDSEYIQFQW